MSWVTPNRENFPDLPHTQANAQLHDAVMVVVSQEVYLTHRVLSPGSVECESITLSARPRLLRPSSVRPNSTLRGALY